MSVSITIYSIGSWQAFKTSTDLLPICGMPST